MVTRFLSLELDLIAPAELQRLILAELRRYGEPLRWAIVAVDGERAKAHIEAVVTCESTVLLPTDAVTLV